MLATVGLLAVLFAFPSMPAYAASVQVTINVTMAEAGAPSFTFTVTGCSVSASSGTSGTPLTVTMDPNCTYTISAGSSTGNGTLRDRLTSSYAVSVSETSCPNSGTNVCPNVSLTAYAEELLVISANCNSPLVSVQSPTSDSWYNYGSVLAVSCSGVWGRSGGVGTRATSWNWNGGTNNVVATTGSFGASQTMNSHRTFNVNEITQYQLTLDQGARLAAETLTTPPITGDAYWYDTGTAVTYQGYGVFGRANGFGNRSASWSLDSGTPSTLTTSGPFTLQIMMSSPHTIHVAVKPQWQVSMDSVSSRFVRSITSPTISKDNYWYDAGTIVTVILNGTGTRTGGVGSRLVSYTLNGGASFPVSTTGMVGVINSVPISAKESISATSTTQYQLLLDSGTAGALSSITPPSIAGDNYWYDSGTQVTYTGSGVFARASGTGLRIASWWIDSGSLTPVLTTGTFSATLTMFGFHILHALTVTQYQVAFLGTSSVSSATSPTISGDGYWYDAGTTVSLSLQGEFGRVAGSGFRMVSYSVNNGAPIPTNTGGSVTVLASIVLTSPQAVSVKTVSQYQVSFDQGVAAAIDSISPPTVAGDNYWYDSGSHVVLSIHGIWGRTSTEGFRLSSYSINGAPPVPVASSGTVAILNLGGIFAPQVVTSNFTTQYLLEVVGGSGSTYSAPSPISGDTGWYDAGTTLRVSTNGVFDSSGGTRQRISGWSIDGGENNPVGPAAVVTSPAIVMNSAHSVTFSSVTQYLVTMVVKDNLGADTISPDSVTLSINGGSLMATTAAWVDGGASLQVTSVIWHGANVAPAPPVNYVVSSPLTVTVNTRVYDATISVKDPLGLPIGGADCSITLANGTTVHASTAGDGTITLHMIPIGTYQGTVSAFGLSSAISGDASVRGTVEAQLPVSWAVILVFVVVALAIVVGLAFLLRRSRRPSYRYNG